MYLAWAPFGPSMVEQFVEAYRRHPAGYPHRLVVALNGFTSDAAREETLRLFAGVPHEVYVAPRVVQDLVVYRELARQADSEFMCFLNSYSTPLADGWLARLAAHATRPGVGLVGATGSWQSLYDWLSTVGGPPEPFPRTLRPRKWAGWVLRSRQWLPHVVRSRRNFPRFPNPHIRSNAFMLRRALFLALKAGALTSKYDAYLFENGRQSMTRQVQARGLETLVVGRDGVGYPPDAWPTSGTYRNREQANLLVADNQTRFYPEGSAARRRELLLETWGVHE